MAYDNRSDSHSTLHNSGVPEQHDFSGNSGKQHIHGDEQKWDLPNGEKVYKGSDDVWRYKDGTVYRGK